MSYYHNPFLLGQSTESGGDVGIDEDAFYKDGSKPATGNFNMLNNSINNIKTTRFINTDIIETPPANTISMYSKTDDSIYFKNSFGVETQIGANLSSYIVNGNNAGDVTIDTPDTLFFKNGGVPVLEIEEDIVKIFNQYSFFTRCCWR